MQYSALASGSKEFRLLTVLPGVADKPLRCLLHHANLGTRTVPDYETISYCWGDPNQRSLISVNGETVSVPVSAARALQRVRHSASPRVLWLDAICINQKDDDERSRQVSIMGDIYRNGRLNLIYLGEENIDAAITSMTAILHEIRDEKDALKRLRNEVGAWQYSTTGIKTQYDPQALFDFYSIGWFRRLWVLQEAALAKQNICFCGSSELDLLSITRVAAWLVYNYYFVDARLRIQCSYAADMNDLVDSTYGYHQAKAGNAPSSLYLLDLAQQRLSSEAVDKVYGILGLTTDANGQSRLDMPVDYHKTAAQVFQDAAWCLIRQDATLQVLDYVRHWTTGGKVDLDGFSSWVPKWHRSKDLDEHPNFMSLQFDACAGRQAVLKNDSTVGNGSPEVLSVTGIHIGQVRHATRRIRTSEADRGHTLNGMIKDAEKMISDQLSDSSHSSDDHDHQGRQEQPSDLDLSIATCMVAGVDSSYKAVGPEVVEAFQAFRKRMRQGTLPVSISHSNDDDHSSNEDTRDADTAVVATQFAEAMWNACMNRSFFTTSLGRYYGLGPYFMRPGDVVVILYGLQYPAILRPLGGGEFLFLGVAYVQGVMFGEYIQQHGVSTASDTVFSIR